MSFLLYFNLLSQIYSARNSLDGNASSCLGHASKFSAGIYLRLVCWVCVTAGLTWAGLDLILK